MPHLRSLHITGANTTSFIVALSSLGTLDLEELRLEDIGQVSDVNQAKLLRCSNVCHVSRT